MQKKPSEVIEMKLKSASYGRLSHNAKCSRCRAKAIISLPSHHANFCEDCFLVFFHKAVNRAMKKFPIGLDTPIMVAVSGGKDSLALWDVLADLGFTTKGIHIDLGIPNFSEASRSACEEFAKSRGLELSIYELKDLFGFSLPEIAKLKSSKVCSVCGSSILETNVPLPVGLQVTSSSRPFSLLNPKCREPSGIFCLGSLIGRLRPSLRMPFWATALFAVLSPIKTHAVCVV
ncbi:MAG: tRNA-5-methyluridine54 2-sulfurtransferase [Thermovirga sp.]|nr:tRNA-5-methyluridine54 2-sulfurtransferase [Thermovirga sp.]